MKLMKILCAVIVVVLSSCSEEPIPRFSLVIENSVNDTTYTYTLTDTSWMVQRNFPFNGFAGAVGFTTIEEDYHDTLIAISKMNPKSYDCKEQHALIATKVTLTNDSGVFSIDPNVNHPKELDAAVRIFNRYLDSTLDLHFEDMQPAIEPDGKLRI